MLVKLFSKSFKLGFNSTWTKNFQIFKLDLEKAIWSLFPLPKLSTTNIKRIIRHDSEVYPRNAKLCFISKDQYNTLYLPTEKENYMIISVDIERVFDKIQHTFLIKPQQSKIEKDALNLINESMKNQ